MLAKLFCVLTELSCLPAFCMPAVPVNVQMGAWLGLLLAPIASCTRCKLFKGCYIHTDPHQVFKALYRIRQTTVLKTLSKRRP